MRGRGFHTCACTSFKTEIAN